MTAFARILARPRRRAAPLPRNAYAPAAAFVPSAARTSSGVATGVLLPAYGSTVAVQVNVTASSGTTPSMALTVEWSDDSSTWFVADPAEPFTAITTTGTAVKTFARKGRFARLRWVLTGTSPSFTFSAATYLTGV